MRGSRISKHNSGELQSSNVYKHICISKFTVKINPAPHMQKDGEGNEKVIKGYQNYIYQFCYKRNVVVEPLKVARGMRFE
jgi:hypothetical protein